MALNFDVSVNKAVCGCDGGITIIASGGYTPYQYSIDGGITYKNSPIFTNLCGGNYYTIVLDVSGQTSGRYTPIINPTGKTIYNVSLSTSVSTLSNNNSFNIKQYYTTITTTPNLPENVYLTFDLIKTSTLNSSPSFSSATKTSSSILTYNTSAITYSFSGQVTGETFNTIPGCQNNTLYTDSISEVWSNLTYYNGDEFYLTTTDTNYKNDSTICYIGDSNESFSIVNLKINGCGCCGVVLA
jgi:hypothetical protein